MPNTRAVRCRRAASSSEYGSTEDSTAMPKPFATDSPVHVGTVRSPSGRVTTKATVIASASPSSCANWVPARPLARMYPAQQVPASAARPSPVHSIWESGTCRAREMRTTPTAAAATASRSRARRASTVARVSGPRNSTVTATPMGRCAREA
ncbi:hypothetical protein ASG70_15830 [Phycicoccus sp. Soil748]|nr:hypothetical protein ASG70_15830 [Phycicoccus sp. Soil748]